MIKFSNPFKRNKNVEPELDVNGLYVGEVYDHQAFGEGPDGKFNGISKATPTGERVILKRLPEGGAWVEVESGKVHIDQVIVGEDLRPVVDGRGFRIINKKALNENGFPPYIFVEGVTPFKEVFNEYDRPTISAKGIASLNAQLNKNNQKSETQERV